MSREEVKSRCLEALYQANEDEVTRDELCRIINNLVVLIIEQVILKQMLEEAEQRDLELSSRQG